LRASWLGVGAGAHLVDGGLGFCCVLGGFGALLLRCVEGQRIGLRVVVGRVELGFGPAAGERCEHVDGAVCYVDVDVGFAVLGCGVDGTVCAGGLSVCSMRGSSM